MDYNCVINTSECICKHVEKYYKSLIGPSEPILFCEFETDNIEVENHLLEYSPTEDVCHYNLKNLSNRQAKKVFKKICPDLSFVKICMPDGSIQSANSDILEELYKLHIP